MHGTTVTDFDGLNGLRPYRDPQVELIAKYFLKKLRTISRSLDLETCCRLVLSIAHVEVTHH
jgi:hypothetical protein